LHQQNFNIQYRSKRNVFYKILPGYKGIRMFLKDHPKYISSGICCEKQIILEISQF